MSMDENNDYSFLEEKIKNDTFDKKKMIYKIARTVGTGLIFGIAASVSFFALKPWAETTFQKDPNEITIPKDEEVTDVESTEEKQKPVQQALTLENYKELSYLLGQVAAEANNSIVQVRAINNNENTALNQKNVKNSTTGVIVADNGQELLVLVNTSVLKDAQSLKVTVADHSEYEAVLKKKDGNIGMAILGISKSGMKQSTLSRVKVADLGNSNALGQGKTLIVLGNPFAYENGVSYGEASSVVHDVNLADGLYNIIVTDIPGTVKSSGVLFNVDGEVVGVIHPDLFDGENSGVLTAYGISSIKCEIELMSNAKNVPYVGIIGTFVTEEIAQAQNIPEGLYVIEIEADSPAMKAGIQAGDVITDIGDKKVESLSAYHNAVISQDTGKEIAVKGQRKGAEEYVEIGFTVTIGMKE